MHAAFHTGDPTMTILLQRLQLSICSTGTYALGTQHQLDLCAIPRHWLSLGICWCSKVPRFEICVCVLKVIQPMECRLLSPPICIGCAPQAEGGGEILKASFYSGDGARRALIFSCFCGFQRRKNMDLLPPSQPPSCDKKKRRHFPSVTWWGQSVCVLYTYTVYSHAKYFKLGILSLKYKHFLGMKKIKKILSLDCMYGGIPPCWKIYIVCQKHQGPLMNT